MGIEPTRPQWPQDFKSCVSTSSTTRATLLAHWRGKNGAEDGIRTRDPDLGKVVLYQLSYFRIFQSKAFLLKAMQIYDFADYYTNNF